MVLFVTFSFHFALLRIHSAIPWLRIRLVGTNPKTTKRYNRVAAIKVN